MQNGFDSAALSDNNPALMSRRKFLGEKALHLRIVEEFLTQIELTLLKSPGEQFDFEPVKNSINELRSLSDDPNSDRRKRVEFQLGHELHRWHEFLADRDAKIEAYHIRRYCDGLRKPLDSDVFIALARFYRDMPLSRNSQSKFDLALTRAFSTCVSDLFRSMTMGRGEIAAQLSELYCSWDRVVTVDIGSPRDVAGFDKFLAESDALDDFESLTNSRLFDRIREFKAELGERFWHPRVAAAAVECNIVVGNHLNGLMSRASQNLGERLGSEFDVAGAFQDTSTNSSTYISEALRQMDSQGPILTAESESEDLSFIRSLFELTNTAKLQDHVEVADTGSSDVEETLSVETPEFRQLLSLLEQHNPNVKEIVAFFDATDVSTPIDLDDFLFGEDQLPDELGREALSVILSLESFRAHELHDRKMLPPEIKQAVMRMLSRAESLGSKVEGSLGTSDTTSGRRLKIANKLLETRLRTERSIFKFTSRGLGLLPEPEPVPSQAELHPESFVQFKYGSMGASRWIVGVVIAVAVLSGLLYTSVGVSAPLAEDVEVIDTRKVLNGRDITSAHRKGDELFAVASEGWSKKSDADKQEALNKLLDTPAKAQIDKVLLLDSNGEPIGEVARSVAE